MKKVLNFGSLNIDHVYRVPHLVRPGETLSAQSYDKFPGGKGLNQSIALARAGIPTKHAGLLGADGLFLKALLEENGVDCSLVGITESEATGHAIIQVMEDGENSIILSGGANQSIDSQLITRAFLDMAEGDFLLLQNEISAIPEIMRAGAQKGMRIFFNPAPMDKEVLDYPLELVETLIVNETEGADLAGSSSADYVETAKILRKAYPTVNILMTLGANGALYCPRESNEILFTPAAHVETVVDTTAAGDTFIGYYLAEIVRGECPEGAQKKLPQPLLSA